MKTGELVIASTGLGLVFDNPGYRPPENYLPDEIQCPHCRRIYATSEDD